MKIIKIEKNKIHEEQIGLIADYLKRGKVIIYPTDTIYGLGCLAADKKAINKIYKIKKREKGKPLLILVSSLAMAKKYCYINKEQEKFLWEAWDFKPFVIKKTEKSPQPPLLKGEAVTVILKSRGGLPKELTGDKNSIAVRLPQNDFLIKIIRKVKIPIVSTSANISGEEYDGSLDKINKLFGNKIDLIVDGGKLKNKPSRIVDLRDIKNIKIIRK